MEFSEGDEGKVPLDNIVKRAAVYKPKERVTYKMIKEYIEAKYGFKVHTAYIAEVKGNFGLHSKIDCRINVTGSSISLIHKKGEIFMEIWDLYSKYREKTGKEHVRGKQIPDGYYHLVVHVWIRNRKGEYLISQRAANRSTCPLMWECVGGSVLKGESSIEGAIREVKEEVGLDLNPEDGRKVFSKIREPFQDIMDVWLFEYDGALRLDEATTGEVADCRWMSVGKIKKLYDDGKLVHTLDYFFCSFQEKEADYSNIIGKTVSGRIDRPLGTRHPKHPDMVYPVNYGYVEGIMAADGAEQDVYVFGTDEPLEKFEGKVIKVFHRFNDVEDKWIVSLDGRDVPDDKILGDIAFQEQFFYGKLYG